MESLGTPLNTSSGSIERKFTFLITEGGVQKERKIYLTKGYSAPVENNLHCHINDIRLISISYMPIKIFDLRMF